MATVNDYTRTTWQTGDVIDATKMNNIETQLDAVTDNARENGVAPVFSTTKTYAVGEHVLYNGEVYRCKTAVASAGAWVASNWTKASLSEDLEGEVSDLKSTTNATDTEINLLHNLINYDYDESFYRAPVPSATNSTKIGIKRDKQIVILNGGGVTAGDVRIKLNGTVVSTYSLSTIKSFVATVQLKQDHGYKFRLEWLSGTIAGIEEIRSPGIVIYKSGESTISSVSSRISDRIAEGSITGDDGLYSVCIYVATGMEFDNAKFLITAEDLSLKTNDTFEYFDSEINYLHGLVNYGYGTEKTVYSQNISSPDTGAAVGVERRGTSIKLNYNGASDYAKRIRISGEISRLSGNSTYKSWIGNLQLTPGKEYRIRIEKIDGVSTLNGELYIPTLVAYESLGSNSLLNLLDASLTSREYSLIAPSGPITLAIYLNSASVLVDCVLSVVVMSSWDDSDSEGVEDYYFDELNDTINKARNELTSPALVFLWSTDNHRHSSNANGVQNFSEMIANMTAFSKNVPCDFVLDTGDLTDGNTTQEITLARAYDCMTLFRSIGLPFVWSQGNHDNNYVGGGSERPYLFTMQECYKAYFTSTHETKYNISENGTDYYIDFIDLKIRFIVLNANNVTNDIEYAYGASTATWLTEALNTDFKILMGIHQSPIRDQVYNRQSTERSAQIVSALQSFINNGGSVVTFTGHSHFDGAWVDPWVNLSQDCQRFSPRSEDATDDAHETTGFIDVIRANARKQYTPTEDCWSVCIYKPDSNELSSIRFGAGKDRYFHITPIAPTALSSKLSGTLTWTTSNSAVATVSNGIVTGISAGKCAVLAKDESGNYECWIIEVPEV